ncbi:MAG: hypothetical protein U0903_12440 [Planctomycetales bacterium]
MAGLIAVDGSLLKALRMAWAVWQDATHRAAMMHVAFGSLRSACGGHAHRGERFGTDELRKLVEPGGFT